MKNVATGYCAEKSNARVSDLSVQVFAVVIDGFSDT